MNRKRRRLLFTSIIFSSIGSMLPSMAANTVDALGNEQTRAAGTVSAEDGQYLGYGYDVTSGKAISDAGALSLAYPILDVNNPDLMNHARVFTSSLTHYESFSSQYVSKVAENYGQTLSGGVDGKIAVVTMSVNAKFNTTTRWEHTASEEYSYYSIYAKNRTVLFQASPETLSNYLHPEFVSAIKKVNSDGDAVNIFKKYGTHLVTGYDLGGIFEMTNYYATSSSTYQKQNKFSFDTQVNAAFGSYGAGANFSFSQEYGLLDNNSYAVNNYKCTTYGGYVFPGLTIDQAFSYYETAFGAGYIYGLWTDSINAGKNLALISVPKSSELIPLWSLLPASSEYDGARLYLINAYIKQCGLSYREFLEEYPDVNGNVAPLDVLPSDIGYAGLGYEYYYEKEPHVYDSYYVSSESYSNKITVTKNSTIAFDFTESLYSSRKLVWTVNDDNSGIATVLDARNGIIHFNEIGGTDIVLTLDDVQIYRVSVTVEKVNYSGGRGTKTQPYMISNAADFIQFTKNEDEWAAAKYYKMTNDIAFNDTEVEQLRTIATSSKKKFYGVFDGGGYCLKGYRLNFSEVDLSSSAGFAVGIFGYNCGTIQNLNVDVDSINTDEGTKVINSRICNFAGTSIDEPGDVYGSTYFGGIVGYNEGKVTDCSIRNFILDVNTGGNGGTVNAGCVVAYNSSTGVVDRCFTDKCSINLYVGKKTEVNVGGVIGFNAKSASRLMSCDLNIDIHNIKDITDSITTSVGGIIGKNNNDGKEISDCLCYNRDIILNNYAFFVSTVYSSGLNYAYQHEYVTPAKDQVYFGGIIGLDKSSKAPNYSRFVAHNLNLMDISEDIYAKSSTGAILGSSDKTPNWKAVIYESFYDILAVSGTTADAEGITAVVDRELKWTLPEFPSEIKDSEDWKEDNDDETPQLVFESISEYSVNFNLENVKRTFLKGEEFKAGEIKVTATDSSGNEVDVIEYDIDASNFDSSNYGTYVITVSALYEQAKYSVRVVQASVSRIKISEPANYVKPVYYEGELFDPEDLDIVVVLENGDDSIHLKWNDPKVEITNLETPLIAGVNLINFKYTDSPSNVFEAVYEVVAERSIVKSVSVIGNNEFSAPVGTKKLTPSDLKDLTLEVKLENQVENGDERSYTIEFDEDYLLKNRVKKTIRGQSYGINVREVEFIFPTIKLGANNVRVCVGGYTEEAEGSRKLIINGYVKDSTQEQLESFMKAVDDLDELIHDSTNPLSLIRKHSLISEALKLKEELSNMQNTEDDVLRKDYEKACIKLEEIRGDYNNKVTSINDDFNKTIIVTNAFNYRPLVSAGFISFPLVLAFFFMIF